MCDLLDPERFQEKLERVIAEKNAISSRDVRPSAGNRWTATINIWSWPRTFAAW